ncbi:MAG: hypothetical protein ACK40N_03300 [Meiothermus ruber]|jgi:hypothetical protein|uniref:hypothetical protein n=1 Tax=Meiothermus ruber TaxID=277 RepID=UPI0039194531
MVSLAPKNAVVPLSLPLSFVGLAALYLLLAVGLVALEPQALGAYRHPVLLAAAHLFFLGFGVGVLMGVMHQLVPVVLEVPLARASLGYLALFFWGLGTPLQAVGFLQQSPSGIALGGGLAWVGLGVFTLGMVLAFRQAPRWNPVATALSWTLFYLMLTPLLGLLQALSLRYGFYDPARLGWHAAAGLVGVFVLSILGVGHLLVGMFSLSHGGSVRWLGLQLWAFNLGLLALVFHRGLGAALLWAGLALAMFDTWNILAHRNKKALDIGVQHYLAGLGFLLLCAGAFGLGHSLVAGLWFALGFVGLVVTGMLYKITPFLIWTHRYAPLVGKQRVPLLKDMLPDSAARLAGLLWGVGALLAPFAPQAIALLVLGSLMFVHSLLEVIRR